MKRNIQSDATGGTVITTDELAMEHGFPRMFCMANNPFWMTPQNIDEH